MHCLHISSFTLTFKIQMNDYVHLLQENYFLCLIDSNISVSSDQSSFILYTEQKFTLKYFKFSVLKRYNAFCRSSSCYFLLFVSFFFYPKHVQPNLLFAIVCLDPAPILSQFSLFWNHSEEVLSQETVVTRYQACAQCADIQKNTGECHLCRESEI